MNISFVKDLDVSSVDGSASSENILDTHDTIHSNILTNLEIIVWDVKRQMLRTISKIINEDYNTLCSKYCPASRPIDSCKTMIVPGIYPIREELEETVYIQPENVEPIRPVGPVGPSRKSIKKSSQPSQPKNTNNIRNFKYKWLHKQWNPDIHCYCRKLSGFCYEIYKYEKDGKKYCKDHYYEYMNFKKNNLNNWFGLVIEKPSIENVNPTLFIKWRDGHIKSTDKFMEDGILSSLNLKYLSTYVAIYISVDDSDNKISGFYNIYTDQLVTLPLSNWGYKLTQDEQKDPIEISNETGYDVYDMSHS